MPIVSWKEANDKFHNDLFDHIKKCTDSNCEAFMCVEIRLKGIDIDKVSVLTNKYSNL